MDETNKKVKRTTKAKALPSLGYLNERFILAAEAGTLTWRDRPLSHFTHSRYRKSWNTRYAGKVAGCITNSGYVSVSVDDAMYLYQRIIYCMATGVDPSAMHVDHIDGNPLNNSLENLRLATNAENLQNRAKLSSTNTSGYRGVTLLPSGRFMAQLNMTGKRYYFGTHATAEQASLAAIAGRAKLFGEFA